MPKYFLTYKGYSAAQEPPSRDLNITQHAVLLIMEEDEDLFLSEKDIIRELEDITVPPTATKKAIVQLQRKKYITTQVEEV